MSATTQTPRIRVADTASILRAAYPAHAAKLAARAADVSARTAEAWVSGRREPAASVLLRMALRCDRMADALQGILDARQAARRDDCGASLDGARTPQASGVRR
jgi:hypothetical protein